MRLVHILKLVIILAVFFCISGNAGAADVGNCLLCHKHPGLSRIDEDGKFRLLFINESIFQNSVHAKVKCEGCHTDIQKIPHDPAKKVDCLTECHIVEPTSEQKFSHKDVEKYLNNSVHGKYDKVGELKKFDEDIPKCKDCHDNPLFRPLSFYKRVRPGISEDAMGRCRICHKSDDFIFRFYNHVTTRLHKIRNPINIAEMCARCHNDPKITSRHDLQDNIVSSYKDTYHGKAASFLDEKIPDCLDCHVRRGESVHQMLSHENEQSSTHEMNKFNICSRVECHSNALPKLASYKVHPTFDKEDDPVQFYFESAFLLLTGGTLIPLMFIMFLYLVRSLVPRKHHKELVNRENNDKD